MIQTIIYLICAILVSVAIGVFASFVISKLGDINAKTNNISKPKHHWSMGIYMDDIPQNEQNTAYLGSVPLKIYERGEYSDLPIPRVGEEVGGVYYSGQNRFDMKGVVISVYYNVDIDWIVVSCKCTEIRKNIK